MSPATHVFIARHGERIDHVDKSWRITAERPHDAFLTERGVQQAHALGKHLAPMGLTHIFCSPFYRTVQTANEVAKQTGLQLKIEPGIAEYLNPEWFPVEPKMIPVKDLKAEFPAIDESYQPRILPEYPETRQQVMDRAGRIAKLLASKYSGKILLVAHGITCEHTARGLLDSGPRPYITYCALQTCVRVDELGERYRIEGFDEPDIKFIPEEIRPPVKTRYR